MNKRLIIMIIKEEEFAKLTHSEIIELMHQYNKENPRTPFVINESGLIFRGGGICFGQLETIRPGQNANGYLDRTHFMNDEDYKSEIIKGNIQGIIYKEGSYLYQ